MHQRTASTTTTARRPATLLSLGAVAALALSACAGQDSGAEGGGETASSAADSAALADAGAPIVCHNPGEVMPFPPDFRSLPVAVFPKRGMAFPRQRPPCQNYSLALPEPSFT